MSDFNIPPEVVEVFLLRIESLRKGPLTPAGAEFVLREVLMAWPGMATIKEADGVTVGAVYLPLSQENSNG